MTIWDQPLETLPLPTRMQSVAKRLELVTVGDLARRHPAGLLLERNLGRTTMQETRAILEGALGMRWEDAALDYVDDEDLAPSVSLDPASLGWDGLSVVLPDDIKARRPSEAPLPPRLVSFAEARGIATVGALLRVSRKELYDAPNLGRRTIVDAVNALSKLREAHAELGTPRAAEWKRLLLASVGKMPLRERMVLSQRAGLVGPAPTLAELGESLGVSRERVRQLEANALADLRAASAWTTRLGDVLVALRGGPLVRLDALVEDGAPVLVDVETDADPFRFVLEVVLEGRAGYVVERDGAAYFSALAEADLEKRLAQVERALKALVFPLARATLPERLAALTGLAAEELSALEGSWSGALRFEEGEVVGYVERRADAVEALLRAAQRPMRVADVAAACGRGHWPEDLVWLDRGLVTLPEQVPEFYVWRRRLGPLVASVMAEHGARQWTTAELLPHVALAADLPEWMTPYALGSLLRHAPEVRYLGRNVVALADSEATTREHIDDTMANELERAGAPLPEAELRARVSARRGVSDLGWSMMRVRKPFVLFEDGTVGLAPRDVPGGEAAMVATADALAAWLEQRDEGAQVADTRLFVQSLGAPAATWDMRMLRSVLRHDGRFRLATGGGLGLAAWGETRTKTQREVLEELLDAGEGRARVADAIAALPTASGEPTTRIKVGMLAHQVGARLAGDFVVRLDPSGAPSLRELPSVEREWVEKVPERAAAVYTRLLRAPREGAPLMLAVAAWEEEMRAQAGPAVDDAQVVRLAEKARALLARAAVEAVSPWAKAARAAVEYLVCVEDGESDVVVGGLDDDEAVLAAVCEGRMVG